MTHILHRSPNVVMPVAFSGSGVEIVDAEGRRYLDASGARLYRVSAMGIRTYWPQCAASSMRSPTRTRLFSPPK
jgi:hypothetical protein